MHEKVFIFVRALFEMGAHQTEKMFPRSDWNLHQFFIRLAFGLYFGFLVITNCVHSP